MEGQFRLLDMWRRREQTIEAKLREDMDNQYGDGSLFTHAVLFADRVPRNTIGCTVFYRTRDWWKQEPYPEIGVLLRSSDAAAEPDSYVGMCVPYNGEFMPHAGIDGGHAAAIGQMVLDRVHWAALRELELTSDTTALVLPPLPSMIPTA
jgi:hypothetical protein